MSNRLNPNVPECATCNRPFSQLHTADHHSYQEPRFGDILLCSNCGTVNKKGLTKIEAMTEEEIEKLCDEEKADLRHARKVIANRLNRQ